MLTLLYNPIIDLILIRDGLDPNAGWILKAGGAAVATATNADVTVRESALEALAG